MGPEWAWAAGAGIALALVLGPEAPAAHAGTIAFTSGRCEDPADRERRRAFFIPPSPQQCRPAIWLIGDDGSGRRRLTEGGQDAFGADRGAAWSPDGQRIAYASGGFIWVMGADGSNPRRVTEGEGPTWTPDGLRIVVSRKEGALGTPGSYDLFAVTLDGRVTTRLTSTPYDEVLPDLSPDGTEVIFTRRPSGEQMFRYLGPGGATLPPEIEAGAGLFSLRVVDGRERRLLSTDIDVDSQFGPRFSLDGRRLVFSSGFSLYTIGADGTDLRRRTQHLTAFDPTWAGLDELIYARNRDPSGPGAWSLARLDLGGNAAITDITTPSPEIEAGPDWSPVGGLVALDPPADRLAPALGLLDAKTGRQAGTRRRPTRALASAVRTVKRRDLRYLAADASGLRGVRVAFGHRSRRRCRFLGRRSYTRPRRCNRPLFRSVTGPPRWRAFTSRLRAGSYVVYMRATDARANRMKRARRIYLRVRR